MKGAPARAIQELAGHADLSTTIHLRAVRYGGQGVAWSQGLRT